MEYRVDLNIFRGPLDLLLFLVRKHEIEITDIPIARITQQYLEYLEVLKELDVNAVGDFLVMASTLMEIKSREMLPQEDESEEPLEDPRADLVRQLLEYKKYRDAASMLEERGRRWQERYGRLARDLPAGPRDPADEPIREVELWDLVSAFGRIIREHQFAQPSNIVYDETPIQVYMERIHRRLLEAGRMEFSALFADAAHKSAMIGMFLAVLELVRYNAIQVEQEALFGPLFLTACSPEKTWDFSQAESYEPLRGSEE